MAGAKVVGLLTSWLIEQPPQPPDTHEELKALYAAHDSVSVIRRVTRLDPQLSARALQWVDEADEAAFDYHERAEERREAQRFAEMEAGVVDPEELIDWEALANQSPPGSPRSDPFDDYF
jgi:hypothetical protein